MEESIIAVAEETVMKMPDRRSNEEEIQRTANQVSECVKQQQREIDSLEELDDLLTRLTITNTRRKQCVKDVKRKMRNLDQQL